MEKQKKFRGMDAEKPARRDRSGAAERCRRDSGGTRSRGATRAAAAGKQAGRRPAARPRARETWRHVGSEGPLTRMVCVPGNGPAADVVIEFSGSTWIVREWVIDAPPLPRGR